MTSPQPQPGDVVTVEPPDGSIVRDRDGATWDCVAGDFMVRNHGEHGDPWRWSEIQDYAPFTLVRWGPAPTPDRTIHPAAADVAYFRDLASTRAVPDREAFYTGALGSASRRAIDGYVASNDRELRAALTTMAAIMEAAQ